jgi:membrane magnesium transporter 1
VPPPPSFILPTALDPKVNLPIDITLETLFSVLLLCAGVVMSSPELKPIQWNVWAGRLERSKEAREIKEVGVGGGNPYAGLEERMGFLDIRKAKKDYEEWSKGSNAQKT